MKSNSWLYTILMSLVATLPLSEAVAQDEGPLAPVEQIHLRGESRGSGSGYSTSVPLDLPSERGGLPVPVSLVHGGMGMGAAGRGWDMPLSFIRENRSLAHRRPTAGAIGAAPDVPLQVELTLMGGSMKMVPEGAGYVQQRGNMSLRAEKSGETWRVYDGEGRTYTFVRPTDDDGEPEPWLNDMWLLEKIEGSASNSRVELVYEVVPRTFADPVSSGVSIDLVRVKYNHSSTDKAKHEIGLNYGTVQSTPLSIDVGGPTVIMRVRTLTGIEVLSREEVGDSDAQLQSLRHYKLAYQVDADTGLPRLLSVSVSGQEGTTKASEELPIARYEYGSATLPGTPLENVPGAPSVKLQFQSLPTAVARPAESSDPVIARAVGIDNLKTVALGDVTGDGRADVMFRTSDGSWKSVAQVPGNNGNPSFSGAAIPLSGGVLPPGQAGAGFQTTRSRSIASAQGVDTDTWRELRDVNGDGRVDYIVANDVERKWVVYVNKPDPANPKLTIWVRQEHDVTPLIDALAAGEHVIDGSWAAGKTHLPLSRVTTGVNLNKFACMQLSDGEWIYQTDSTCGITSTTERLGQISGTAWQLMDVNGDGALDLVMSTDPLRLKKYTPTYAAIGSGNTYRIEKTPYRMDSRPQEGASSYIGVVYGRYTVGLVPTSTAITLLNKPVWGGVSAWKENSGFIPDSAYGLLDVNGDGLMDFFEGNVAWLGNGKNFTTASLRIPFDKRESFGGQFSNGSSDCADKDSYGSFVISQLTDITGDGIPDFIYPFDVYLTGYNARHVAIGTGAGFRPPVKADYLALPSSSVSACNGSYANVTGGLYDLDGDGRKEGVTVDASSNAFNIQYLVGSSGPRALSAGQLTAIENGHGERTEISYESAKDDATTLHQTPSPEIVVGKIKKIRSGQAVTETTYAYGNPLYGFDPLEQRFRNFGYSRSVAVTATDSEGRLPGAGEAQAVITDRAPFALDPRSDALRMLSILRGGTVSNVTELAGKLSVPRLMLNTNVTNDPRRFGATTYGYNARVSINNDEDAAACAFIENPYVGTMAEGRFSTFNTCKTRGFAYQSVQTAWRGEAALPSDKNVTTDSSVVAIDDFGRVTKKYLGNDSRVATDNVCVTTSYAAPVAGLPRVLSAISANTVGTGGANTEPCVNSSARSVQRYEYDGLPAGKVSTGLLTGQTAERRDALTGALLGTVRLFDATYDTRGRKTSVTSTSDDRTRQVTMLESDPFDLVSTKTRVEATGAVTQDTVVTIDPVTMLPASATDANGLVTSTRYDGFGRPVMSLIQAPGESEGALTYTEYLGFAGGDADGRRIVEKSFDNPVSPSSAATATGHTTTTSLDEAGRITTSIADLGSDYADDLVTSAITYDELGRVAFAADPFPDSQDATTAYGTTYFYNTDGTPKCSIRGRGPQDFADIVDHAQERYPTCYRHWFALGQEWVGVMAPDALDFTEGPDVPQIYVERRAMMSAIGQVFERQTWQGDNTMLERSTFSYDLLGNIFTHNRAKVEAPNEWVESSFVHDSFGQVLFTRESGTLGGTNVYSNWGELLETSTPAGASTPARKQTTEYDGLGRPVQRQELNDGVVDAATIHEYTYDTGISIHSGQPATYVVGRLATATSPTSEVYVGYDAMGRTIAKATKDPQDEIYVETMKQDADGAATERGMLLPDAGHALEKVEYGYDSARRLRTATHTEGGIGTQLYSASSIDAFGRIRNATVGPASGYAAQYADTGRRLMNSVAVASPDGYSRAIGFVAHDAVGRELQRRESKNSAAAITYTSGYDALGRLSNAETSAGMTQSFGYDSLGNVLSIGSSNDVDDRYLTYRSDNRDRLCVISKQVPDDPTACNVNHDALGNIAEQPTATGTRTLSYFGSGAVKQIAQSGATADFRYDAFGAVQELTITGGTADARRDRRYGMVEKRDTTNGVILTRNFPIGGMNASRRGHGNDWVFAIGEGRGNRFFVDIRGNFVQDATYDAYGRPTLEGPLPQEKTYSREQWNGGDFLATFSLSHLGARLYDPVIGRFLSPDPLMLMNTASSSNPYAFAYNDPINFSDPSGMCPPEDPTGCGTYNDSQGDFYEQNSGSGGRPSGSGGGLPHPDNGGRHNPQTPEKGSEEEMWDIIARACECDPKPSSLTGIEDGLNPNIVRAADKATNKVAATFGDWTDVGEWGLKGVEQHLAGNAPTKGLVTVRSPEKLSSTTHRTGAYRNPIAEHARTLHGWKVAGRLMGIVGAVGDAAQFGNAVATAIRNPTDANVLNVGETGAGVVMMSIGPYGWFANLVGIPATKAYVGYLHDLGDSGTAKEQFGENYDEWRSPYRQE